MKYQVGDLIDFQDDDPEFETLEQAYRHALAVCKESDEAMLGVWTDQDSGSELLAIVYQGEVYVK